MEGFWGAKGKKNVSICNIKEQRWVFKALINEQRGFNFLFSKFFFKKSVKQETNRCFNMKHVCIFTHSLKVVLSTWFSCSLAETVKSQSRKPKCSKGYHCSRNAYMLVYKVQEEESSDPSSNNVQVPGELYIHMLLVRCH